MDRYLPLCCMASFALGTAWRIAAHVRRCGQTGVNLFRGGGWPQHLNDAAFVLIVCALAVEAIFIAVQPEYLAPVAIASLARSRSWRMCGAGLALVSMVLCLMAQVRLGASWRIGIDEGARPGLITSGLYRWSRNPIFLFMLAAMVGYAILVPTWISFAALILAYAGIRRQIQVEEKWLTCTYGDDYLQYASRIGRFLPWFGRLHRSDNRG